MQKMLQNWMMPGFTGMPKLGQTPGADTLKFEPTRPCTAYTKRRKQIWEALHPAEVNQRFESVFDALGIEKPVPAPEKTGTELEVGQLVPPQVKTHGGARPQTKGFVASTAESTGMTKQAINRALARADALGDDALAKVTNTSLDSGHAAQ